MLPHHADTSPRPLRLAVFDLDSTLINQEVIDELAASIGRGAEVGAITERAMRGELDFAASLRERVGLLRGVPAETVWEGLKKVITFAEGARELCRGLRKLGVRLVVLSGGFQPMVNWVVAELGLDEGWANHVSTFISFIRFAASSSSLLSEIWLRRLELALSRCSQLVTSPATDEIPFPHLTGQLDPKFPIVTAARKRVLLENIAAEHGIPLCQTMCVGDGANDLEMLGAVGEAGGIGIAFKAKEKVQKLAPNRLNGRSLLDLLYLTGRTEGEISGLVN